MVLVVETLLGRAGYEVQAAFSDLNMLVLPGGRERTEQEYAALLEAADLRLTGVVHTSSRMSIVEARAPVSLTRTGQPNHGRHGPTPSTCTPAPRPDACQSAAVSRRCRSSTTPR